MKKVLILLVGVSGLALLAWVTGFLTWSSQAIVLCIAFLADYLTPHHLDTLAFDQAWRQWWQIGEAARWARYQHDPSLQQATQDYAIAIVSGLALLLFLFIPWKDRRLRASTVHGSAHWATLKEAHPFLQRAGSKTESSIPLGTYKGRQMFLRQQTMEEHVLVVGPSGKGKTAGIIVPGLLSERGERSLVIIDPKRELVSLTAGAVARYLDVRLFAPLESARSQRYNPLAHIHSKRDADAFAACWVSNTGRSSSDPFWDRSAEALIALVVLHLRAVEPQAPFARLVEVLSSSSFEDLDKLLSHSPSLQVEKAAAAFMRNLRYNEKTAGGIMTDVAGRFARFYGDASLDAVTAGDEMDFTAMVEPAQRSIALYIAIPAEEAPALKPLTACLLMQMFKAFIQGSHEKGVTCYLDEFANAGTIPQMSEYITMLRSRRVALLMAIQNHSQLDARYGKEDADTIKSNASTHIVLPGAGQSEAEFYSRRIGDTTVIGQSVSNSIRATNGSTNQGQQETSRKLIMPEEIRTMKKGQMLLLSDTVAPIQFHNRPYYKRRDLLQCTRLPFPALSTGTLTLQQPDGAGEVTRKEPAMTVTMHVPLVVEQAATGEEGAEGKEPTTTVVQSGEETSLPFRFQD